MQAFRRTRRALIALIGLIIVSPKDVRGQQDRRRRIGVLMGIAEDDDGVSRVAALREGLRQLGWNESRNLQIEYRWAAGDRSRANMMAKELIEQSPELLIAGGITALTALGRQTRAIPIVFAHASDPVGSGLVESLAHPGGNVTGFTTPELTVPAKYLELVKDVAPGIHSVVIIFGAGTVPGSRAQFLDALQKDARSLGLKAVLGPISDANPIQAVLSNLGRDRRYGIVVLQDIFTTAHRGAIIDATAKYRLPAVYATTSFATRGGLISYGSNPTDTYRQAASYVDRILKGEKPSDLPIQQPTRFELAVNMKAAKALGVTFPRSIMVRADRIIE